MKGIKSFGALGFAGAGLDGVITYNERKDKYGETSAAIDGTAHAVNSLAGAVAAGAIVGTFFPFPVVGTVAGAVLGFGISVFANTIYDFFAHGKWDGDNFKLWE